MYSSLGQNLDIPDDPQHLDPCPLSESQYGWLCGFCGNPRAPLTSCRECGMTKEEADENGLPIIRRPRADDCRCEGIAQAGYERELELRGGRL